MSFQRIENSGNIFSSILNETNEILSFDLKCKINLKRASPAKVLNIEQSSFDQAEDLFRLYEEFDETSMNKARTILQERIDNSGKSKSKKNIKPKKELLHTF